MPAHARERVSATNTMRDLFRRFAHASAAAAGSVWAFVVAFLVVLVWVATGPLFRFSDTWQLVINTGTTIVTFLMVFLIQNSQNRDSKSLHLKVDELLRAVAKARTGMVDLEDMSEEELKKLDDEFKRLRKRSSDVSKKTSTN
jgi:low affinity Fe/Cu permease